jgi:hypothetical protein
MPVPRTELRTSHAITLRAADVTIGRIQNWSPSQARDVKLKFEINAVGTGAPIEAVPGVATTQTLQVTRYDLYTQKMEEIWGMPKPLWALTDQHNPIDIEEKWIKFGTKEKPLIPGMELVTTSSLLDKIGSKKFGKALGLGTANELEGIDIGRAGAGQEVTVEKNWYTGCWFTSLGRVMQAQGDRLILVNATLVYVKMRRLM